MELPIYLSLSFQQMSSLVYFPTNPEPSRISQKAENANSEEVSECWNEYPQEGNENVKQRRKRVKGTKNERKMKRKKEKGAISR
jgi:hypothetical protein